MINKHGTAHWSGGIKEGGGEISTQTGVLKDQAYGFNARFEGGPGTNPEELIGAAHGNAGSACDGFVASPAPTLSRAASPGSRQASRRTLGSRVHPAASPTAPHAAAGERALAHGDPFREALHRGERLEQRGLPTLRPDQPHGAVARNASVAT